MKWHIKLLVVLARQACTGLNTFATCLDMNISNSKQASKKTSSSVKKQDSLQAIYFPRERENERKTATQLFFLNSKTVFVVCKE